MVPSSKPTTVYVRLLDEGTDVWRPVPADDLGDGRYRLHPADNYDSDDETWEFLPGATVLCQLELHSNGIILIATRPAEA